MRILIMILVTSAIFFACSRKQIPAQAKVNIIPAGVAERFAEVIVPPSGEVQLTFDSESNIQRIRKLPGFEKLTPSEQQRLIKAILSTVPIPVTDTSKR